MSNGKPQNDPSMDDILASIRKIISDDEARSAAGPGTPGLLSPHHPTTSPAHQPAPAHAAAPAEGDDDVLLLTELVEEPPAQPAITPIPPRSGAMDQNTPQPAIARPAAAPPSPGSSMSQRPAYGRPPASPPDLRGVSAAFDRLNHAVSESVPAGGGMTVEALMREMLKPALQEWVDKNLPGLVEKVIDLETMKPLLQEWMDKNLPGLLEQEIKRMAAQR